MRRNLRSWNWLLALGLCGAMMLSALGDEPQKMTMWGTPPKEKPHFTKAAEGFPPLPLPVVPQRRSEKKRPPAPPLLLANLSGFSFDSWQGSPGAVDTLLYNARKNLDIWYGWEQLNIHTLQREAAAGVIHRTPVLYLCAYYPLNFTKEQRDALASYVLGGGTLLINCCGQEPAYTSTKAELTQMFPKYELRQLPPDHPLYSAYYKIEQVRYPVPSSSVLDEGAEKVDSPHLQAITLGTRAAVIVSYEDLACGWNQWNNPTVPRVNAQDATKLGLNIITYATSELRLAKFLSKTQEVAGPNVRPREQLVFAQLVHNGNWDPNPSAIPLFLKELASNTSIAVQFERQQIELKDPTLFNYPLLYLTGTWDPGFSKEELALLHRYLSNGGVLLVDSAAGRLEFDVAFRKLCRQLFPDHPLQPLPAQHPLYSCFYKIASVAVNHEKDPVQPEIEAVIAHDRPVILYSKLGLGDGWAHVCSAYAHAYAPDDAVKLGTNLIVYAMQ